MALTIIGWQLAHFGGLYAASDDSYIYLGYVKRALEPPRALFSYNPGRALGGHDGVVYYYALIVAAAIVRLWTFFLPLSTTLTLAMWLLNALLFVGCAGLLARMVRQLTDGSAVVGNRSALALLLWSVKFMWGMFAGLENPLTAFLVMALAYAADARRAAGGHRRAQSGLLIGTRPDLAPTRGADARLRRRLRAVRATRAAGQSAWSTLRAAWRAIALARGRGHAGAAAVYGAMVLPCYVTHRAHLPERARDAHPHRRARRRRDPLAGHRQVRPRAAVAQQLVARQPRAPRLPGGASRRAATCACR